VNNITNKINKPYIQFSFRPSSRLTISSTASSGSFWLKATSGKCASIRSAA
jgi:hypothetical protein